MIFNNRGCCGNESTGFSCEKDFAPIGNGRAETAGPKKERSAGIPTDLSNLNPNPNSKISGIFEVCKLGREKIFIYS